ncbi:hypothetical protein P3T76_003234 [Phytophthora citrophthora]|uniref:M96 mating-specific protein family n=1 Tax=Phytophthora citrophthora TaxID=4793 RepID=A0AAD9GV91_9STRA|nr:hypothetical protein P3T76_003234 [Phytophthora citrophthora]
MSGLNAQELEATLSVVDESLLNTLPVTTPAPSFDVDCVDTFMMIPFRHIESLRVNASSAGFQVPDETKRPAKKVNPNRARDNAQYNLVYLREKVNELEAKLQSLRLNSKGVENAGSIGRMDSMPRVWEEISSRQKRHRDRAEHENARLRVVVQRKQKMVNGLCAVLQKHILQQSLKCSQSVELSQCSIRVMDFEGDIEGFQDLFQRLEAAYAEIHDVFAEARLSDCQFGSEAVHVLKSADDNHIEVLTSKELPFRMEDTGEAAWDLFKGVDKHLDNGGLYGKTMKNLEQPFTILEDFQKEVFSRNLRADVQAKQLIRRCVEPDKDMILFVSSMTPIEIKHKAVEGITYHVREYVLTKRTADSVPGHELSLLQLCTRISIECNPGTTFDAKYLRSVAKFWIGNIGGNFRCYLTRIENALVDRALRGHVTPFCARKRLEMELVGGEDDMRAFEATLSFVEEYASDAFASTDLPAISVTSDVSNSFSFRLEDQMPPDIVPSSSSNSPVATIDTSAMTPANTSAMTPANSSTQFSMGVSKAVPAPSQASNPRKSTRKRKPQTNPNRARNELRFELAFLREKVTQLQQELQALQPPEDDGESTTLATRANGRRSRPSSQVLCAWKGVADRQLRRREGSERENARLRMNVEHQRKVAIDLTKLLRKRMAECAEAQDPSVKENRFTRVLDYHGDLAEFQELFPILEDAYHDLDAVLQETGLATMDIPTEDVHIREGVGGKYVEFFANKVLPFKLSDTTEAAWDHFKGIDKHCGNGELYEKAAMNLDQPFTIIEDFTKEVYSNSSRADMQMKQIVRRYVEPGRDVIMFVCRGKPIEIKHKAIAGLTYHLRSYVIAKRAPASTADHELSLLQFCSRISIDKEPGVVYDPVHVRALTRFLIGNTAGNMRCYQERIENALVDQALKRQLEN